MSEMADLFKDEESLEKVFNLVLQQQSTIEELDEALKEAKKEKKILDANLIEKMKEQGITSAKMLDKTVSFKEVAHVSVLKEDRQIQIDWLRVHNCGSLVKETVNANTFSAFITKDWDKEIPVWVKIYKADKLSVRR